MRIKISSIAKVACALITFSAIDFVCIYFTNKQFTNPYVKVGLDIGYTVSLSLICCVIPRVVKKFNSSTSTEILNPAAELPNEYLNSTVRSIQYAPDFSQGNDAAITVDRQLHILVVDDVQVNRVILKRVLEQQGHTVVEAENGQEAVSLVGTEAFNQPFDAVFMDLCMPIMDGIEATRIIRINHSKFALPIVAYTSNDLNTIEDLQDFNSYLKKPATITTIIDLLKKIIIDISTPITYGYSNSGTGSEEQFTPPEPIRNNYIDRNSPQDGSIYSRVSIIPVPSP